MMANTHLVLNLLEFNDNKHDAKKKKKDKAPEQKDLGRVSIDMGMSPAALLQPCACCLLTWVCVIPSCCSPCSCCRTTCGCASVLPFA